MNCVYSGDFYLFICSVAVVHLLKDEGRRNIIALVIFLEYNDLSWSQEPTDMQLNLTF